MVSRASGTAEEALEQQIEILGGRWYSLGDLWRASGCPEGLEPRAWADLATPLIVGFASYARGVASSDRGLFLTDDGPLRRWGGEDADPWRRGDLMAGDLIARAYAAYLDGLGHVPGREVEDIAEDKHRPLPRRQQLHHDDERERYRLASLVPGLRARGGRQRPAFELRQHRPDEVQHLIRTHGSDLP